MNLATPGNVYLCTYTLIEHRYPDRRDETPNQFRIVWADTEEQAREKLIKAIEVDNPYAYSARADYITIHRAIE